MLAEFANLQAVLIHDNESFDHLDVLNMSWSGQFVHDFVVLSSIFICDPLYDTAVNINNQRCAHTDKSVIHTVHQTPFPCVGCTNEIKLVWLKEQQTREEKKKMINP